MGRQTANCLCRVSVVRGVPQIDSTLCRLNPILGAFSQIEAMAAQLSKEGPIEPMKGPVGSGRAGRRAKTKTWAERWALVKEALESVDRVMEEQENPRASWICGLCQKPIEEGTFFTFHGKCYDERSKPQIDVRHLKEEASRVLARSSPARELILAMPDRISKVEMPGYFIAVLNLLKSPEERF